MQETQEMRVWSLGGEDSLEEEVATHCSILAWRIPMDRGAWWAAVHGAAKSHPRWCDWACVHAHRTGLKSRLWWRYHDQTWFQLELSEWLGALKSATSPCASTVFYFWFSASWWLTIQYWSCSFCSCRCGKCRKLAKYRPTSVLPCCWRKLSHVQF